MSDFEYPSEDLNERFMRVALREARAAAEDGEVPAGCVIVRAAHGAADFPAYRIVAKSHNMTESLKDPTAHAEMLAITQAAEACGDWRLTDCVLYATKEPCPMCAGAIVLARIPLVVWGIGDPKRGGESVFGILNHPDLNHRPTVVYGICAKECEIILKDFFAHRRAEK